MEVFGGLRCWSLLQPTWPRRRGDSTMAGCWVGQTSGYPSVLLVFLEEACWLPSLLPKPWYCCTMTRFRLGPARSAATVVLISIFWLPFKAVNRGKGLLPDPTVMQILTGLNNPAALKMLLNPMVQGNKQGKKNLWRGADRCCYCVFSWFLHVQASLVQPLQSRCWPTLPFLLPCSRFFFRTKPKSNRYCCDIWNSPESTSLSFSFLLAHLPNFFSLPVFSVDI